MKISYKKGIEFIDKTDGTIGLTIDGAGSVITTGIKAYLYIPFDCEIQSWALLADTLGDIVIDIWKDTYANYPPTVLDTITGADKPTLSGVIKNQNLTINPAVWTVTVSAGDTLCFNVDSVATVTKINLILGITKT